MGNSVIMRMLSNEKYMGDVIQQKSYTVDYLSKKRAKNKGELQKYLIEKNHEPIIPKEIFDKVQSEMLRRSSRTKEAISKKSKDEKKGHSKYILSRLLVCGECEQPFRRLTWTRSEEKQIVWRCYNRVEHGTKNCKNSPTLEEKRLQETVMNAVNKVSREDTGFDTLLRKNIILTMNHYMDSFESETPEIDERIQELEQEMLLLMRDGAEDIYDKKFLEQYETIGKEIRELKQRKLMEHQTAGTAEKEKLPEGLQTALNKCSQSLVEFDETLIGQIIEKIKVINEKRIEIVFKSGLAVNEIIAE